jgi:O-antigen biosynthesis protein WbqP
MKRVFDLVLAALLLILFCLPMLLIALAVKLTSRGGVLYWSQRVGQDNTLFLMPKFRTMRTDTPQLATHLLTDTKRWITPIGNFLRSTSLDELPQLWSILVGDMSFVGPRPALFNQEDLVALRTTAGIHRITPGLTGWAQVNGRDELPIPEKVHFELYYRDRQSFLFDLKILALTAIKVIRREGIMQADERRVQAKAEVSTRRAA